MVPSTRARQTGSPSTSTAMRSPSSKSLNSATLIKSVIRLSSPCHVQGVFRSGLCGECSGMLDTDADDGQDRAGHAVTIGRDEEERGLDDLVFAHPLCCQLFRGRLHRLKIGLRIDEARGEGVDENTRLLAL